MTILHDVRRAAETMPHDRGCVKVEAHYRSETWIHGVCKCRRADLLTTLDAAEKHLREMVLRLLDEGKRKQRLPTGQEITVHNVEKVCTAHDHLAAFLNADEPKGGDAECSSDVNTTSKGD